MAAVSNLSLARRLDISPEPPANHHYYNSNIEPTDSWIKHRDLATMYNVSRKGGNRILNNHYRISAKCTLVGTSNPAQYSNETNGSSSSSSSHRTVVDRSMRDSLVAESDGAAKVPHSAPQGIQIGPNSQGHANAVDGALSLSIRPFGWTSEIFGKSIRKLGSGTGGSVDLHHSKVVNKVVAVKTFITKEKDEEKAPTPVGSLLNRRMLEELGIAMNVHHKNIVKTFEVIVETDHRCYVVMEPCIVDLFTLIQKHAVINGSFISSKTLDCYFVQIVHGVQYLNGMGIAHRDLKLDNLCVTDKGIVKIVDFGCATLFRRKIPTASPANAATDAIVDLHSDINGQLQNNLPSSNHYYQQQQQTPYLTSKNNNTACSKTKLRHKTHLSRPAPYSIQSRSVPNNNSIGWSRDGLTENVHKLQTKNTPKYTYVETFSSGLCGSDPYMAPELFTAKPYMAAKVDMWAIGIIYLAMHNMQFPWSIAQSKHDPRYASFLDDPKKFCDSLFGIGTRRFCDQIITVPSADPLSFLEENNSKQQNINPPSNLSPRDSVYKLLDPNPQTRLGINELINDPWFNSLYCCHSGRNDSCSGFSEEGRHEHWVPDL